jgi:small subunit ribosomal protein S7
MLEGKKSTAFGIFYGALDRISEQSGEDGYGVWKKACSNVMPAVQVKSRRIGGATFQIPAPIREDQKISMTNKWIISFARKRSGRSMEEKLAAELLAAFKGEGQSVKKKEDTHKMAEANKAFAHFRV